MVLSETRIHGSDERIGETIGIIHRDPEEAPEWTGKIFVQMETPSTAKRVWARKHWPLIDQYTPTAVSMGTVYITLFKVSPWSASN